MNKNIMLLHGWGAETKKLLPLKKELEKLGWRAYLPEIAGFGKPAPSEIWGIEEYADCLYKEALGYFDNKDFFVFGHSFGGGIAIGISSKIRNNLKGVVLCATRGISRGNKVKRIFFGGLAKAGKIFLLIPIMAKSFKNILYKLAKEHDYEKLDGIMKQIFKKVISLDLKPLLSEIKVPVLILWGKNDRMTNVGDAFYINKIITKSKLKVYKNQGHKLPYEKPKELAKEIDLWRMSQK